MKNFYFAFCIVSFALTKNAFGSEAGMPQLNPEFWAAQVFWLILIFSLLYLVIEKIFLPKITYSIENRKSKVINDINDAQKIKESAEKKLEEYNKIIEKSQKEAKKIIEESNKKLSKDIDDKKNKFNEEIEKELIAAEKEINNMKKSSISKINNISVETTAEIIKELINVDVNKSNVSAIVEDITKKEIEKNI